MTDKFHFITDEFHFITDEFHFMTEPTTLEHATDSKALANAVKHQAFIHCSQLNLYGMVDAQIAFLESELLTQNTLAA